jgi:hypothetical protein
VKVGIVTESPKMSSRVAAGFGVHTLPLFAMSELHRYFSICQRYSHDYEPNRADQKYRTRVDW